MVLASLAVLSASVAAGFSGFGFNIVALPVLALLLPTKDAVTIGLVLGLLSTGTLALRAVRHDQIHLRALSYLLLGSAPGLVVGTLVFASLSSGALRTLIAVIALGFPLLYLTMQRSAPLRDVNLAESLGVGFLGGSFAATTGTGGPPVVVYLLSTVRDTARLRGTILSHVAAVTALALLAHALRGEVSHRELADSARLAPATIAGVIIGSRVFHYVPTGVYEMTIKAIITIVSIAGIALALR